MNTFKKIGLAGLLAGSIVLGENKLEEYTGKENIVYCTTSQNSTYKNDSDNSKSRKLSHNTVTNINLIMGTLALIISGYTLIKNR